ncbi:MAG TPA: hypothetical protein VIJ85_10375 [Rhizomicrobium sp.]
MQISNTASLLAAQQARPPAPSRAAQASPAEAEGFEPLIFASKPQTPASNAAGVPAATPRPAAPFARLGSQIDIKV